jgi:hypothetical protein
VKLPSCLFILDGVEDKRPSGLVSSLTDGNTYPYRLQRSFIMATATICSTFDFTLIAGAGALSFSPPKTFTAPRAFTIVGVTVQNSAAAAGTLTILNTTAGTVISGTTAAPPIGGPAVYNTNAAAESNPAQNITIIDANASVSENDVIAVDDSVADQLTKIVFTCIGNPSQSITIA